MNRGDCNGTIAGKERDAGKCYPTGKMRAAAVAARLISQSAIADNTGAGDGNRSRRTGLFGVRQCIGNDIIAHFGAEGAMAAGGDNHVLFAVGLIGHGGRLPAGR